ncbi:MAG: hypothetical protein KGL39_42825 [Patescibacteria group bacterium]|nr:hypothetical protein [Patescibacteria group bacterium]
MSDPSNLDRDLRVVCIPSTFGGGWAYGLNDPSREWLVQFTGDEAAPLMPLGGVEGHIIEPWAWGDLLSCVRDYDGTIVSG